MQLIRLLADGQYHSGEQLGAQIGIGRAAVWKRVAALRSKGIEIEVLPRKGYRLKAPIELLSAEKILSKLSLEMLSQISTVSVRESVGSTNDVAADLMLDEKSLGVICFAEEQTKGRGRRGRSWVSPIGNNLYCSIGWRFPSGMSRLEGLSLAIGVAVVRALHRYGVNDVGLKWPNDLLIGNGKLGGILVELQAEMGGVCNVIIGVGLNLAGSMEVRSKVEGPVIDLASHTGRSIERNLIAALVVEDVVRLLMVYPAMGFPAFRDEWSKYDSLSGAEVKIEGVEGKQYGFARGVNEKGALILETVEGERIIHGGEVSLRRQL